MTKQSTVGKIARLLFEADYPIEGEVEESIWEKKRNGYETIAQAVYGVATEDNVRRIGRLLGLADKYGYGDEARKVLEIE